MITYWFSLYNVDYMQAGLRLYIEKALRSFRVKITFAYIQRFDLFKYAMVVRESLTS